MLPPRVFPLQKSLLKLTNLFLQQRSNIHFYNLQKQALCSCAGMSPSKATCHKAESLHLGFHWEREQLSQAELHAKPLWLNIDSNPLKILPKSLEINCLIPHFGNNTGIFIGAEQILQAACS